MLSKTNKLLDIQHLIVKLSARCNLNCTYCYIYNKADDTHAVRPALMTESVQQALVAQLASYSTQNRGKEFRVSFHGGEPCLFGVSRLEHFCSRIKDALEPHNKVKFFLQTNGTLISKEWVNLFKTMSIRVGVSLDGPRKINDANRIDHKLRGSFNTVMKGISLLKHHEVEFDILNVIQLGSSPIKTHEFLKSLGSNSIIYIMPDFTHDDDLDEIRAKFGPTPCADFLLPIFRYWMAEEFPQPIISDIWNMIRIVFGGRSRIETFGNEPTGYCIVETDGQIEGLDTLRSCYNGASFTGLNVFENNFGDLADLNNFHSDMIFGGQHAPLDCAACPELKTCGGGYFPHRYSSSNGFENRSIWCADLLKIFEEIRFSLGVDDGLHGGANTEDHLIKRNRFHSSSKINNMQLRG